MTKKICIVGAPSCRKSTTSVSLEGKLKSLGYNADTAEEYARTYIQRYGVPFNPFQQLLLFEKQMRREQDIISTGADFMITDTAPWAGHIYTKLLIDSVTTASSGKAMYLPDMIKKMETEKKAYDHLYNEILKKCTENIKTYDYIFFAPVAAKVIDDGVRTQTDEEREALQRKILAFAELNDVSVIHLTGTPEDRVEQILGEILPDYCNE